MENARKKGVIGARYLSFVLHDEEYCLDILCVKEIRGMTEVTKIPQTPDFIKGVINLRGQMVPIIDLRLKFQMPAKDYNKRTCIIIVEMVYEGEGTYMGIVVDSINEVITIPKDKITKVPYINAKIKSEYIQGIAEKGSKILIILDISKVLTDNEFVELQQLGQSIIEPLSEPINENNLNNN